MSVKTWSDDEEAQLRYLYVDCGVTDVHQLAYNFNKGYRSVISKLVQLKIYIKPEVDENKVTVKHLFRDLETLLGISIEGINLNKKENLQKVVEALKEKLGV